MTIYQTLSLLVSFEYILLLTKGGPFYDTTVYALYVYRRAFESGQYGYWRGIGALPHCHRRGRRAASDGASSTWSACCSGRASRFTENGEAGRPYELHARPAAVDWDRMAARARSHAPAEAVASLRFPDRGLAADHPALTSGSSRSPSSAKTGVAETVVLWRSMLVLIPAVIAFWLAAMLARNRRRMWLGMAASRARRGGRIRPAGRSRPAPAQFHIPGGAGFRIGRALACRGGARRSAVPQCLARLRQFAADRRCADGHRRDRRLARRLLPVALAVSRARRDAALAAGAARLPGADADRPDVPDALLDRAPGYALRRHSWCSSPSSCPLRSLS